MYAYFQYHYQKILFPFQWNTKFMGKGIYNKLQRLLLPHSFCFKLIFVVLPVGPNALNITYVYGWLQGTMAYIFKRDFFLLTDNTFKAL